MKQCKKKKKRKNFWGVLGVPVEYFKVISRLGLYLQFQLWEVCQYVSKGLWPKDLFKDVHYGRDTLFN